MFKLIVRISRASLIRRKSRSLMVIAMIASCLWGLLLMEGIYDGMTEQVIGNTIRSSSGHVALFARGFRLDKGLDKLITQTDAIERFITKETNITSHTLRLSQDCLIATPHYSQNGTLHGVDLAAEETHGRLQAYLIEGHYSFGKKKRGAILGAKLAGKLKVGIGKKIILSAQDTNNEISAIALKVSGILRTNNIALDESSVFIDMDMARKLLQVEKGITQLSILVEKDHQIAAVQDALKKEFADLDILRWDEMFPALLQSRVMMKIFNLVTSFIVFCAAGLGIYGVMVVSVLERLREFGVMMAIGTQFRQIGLMVMVESFSMSLLGFMTGSILGGASLFYFVKNGLDLTMFSEGLEAFGIDTIVHAIIRPEYFLTAFFAIFIASFISILYPLWLVRKSNPIETINRI